MGGKNQTQTQSSTNTPAGLSQLQDIWGRVQQAASTPYTAYSGPQVAGLSGTQQAGIQGITNAQGTAQPYFDQASQYATQGASAIDPAAISRYQNPYTQQVVDATQEQFNHNNQIQQSQVLGNSAARGALGSRTGVNAAELARQQEAGQAPTIAGLYSSGYNSALGAAQQDRAAAAQGAYTFGALAPSVQNAQISGAQAQIGAGGLEQGTNQAQLTANYNDYLRQQAFPYQQAGFLASSGLPAVTSMGGTTNGQLTTPGPNPYVQAAGLGLSAASLFSDRRIKSDVQKIGKTFDGQPIYSFRYGNDPHTQIGLIAQDVEKTHPEAVGEVGGIKTVDYKAATADAEGRKGFASGGVVNFMDTPSYVPAFQGGGGGGSPYGSAPQLMGWAKPQADPMAGLTADKFKAAGQGIRDRLGTDVTPTGFTGNTDTPFAGQAGATTSYMGGVAYPMFNRGGTVNPRHVRFHETVHAIRQTLRRGGAVSGYADGGSIRSESTEHEIARRAADVAARKPGFIGRAIFPGEMQIRDYKRFPYERKMEQAGDYANGGTIDLSPAEYVRNGFADSKMAMDDGTFDPQGANAPGDNAFVNPQVAAAPMPRPRPEEAPTGPMTNTAALPPVMTQGAPQGDDLPEGASAYARRSPYSAGSLGPTPTAENPIAAPANQMGGWNPFKLSDDARSGLMAAGLGIAASRSPFALSAIGEGGLTGMKAYGDATSKRASAESEARKLAQTASQFSQNMGLHRDQLAETKRQHDIGERTKLIPPGFRQTDDGSLEAIPGGPQDPKTIESQNKAKRTNTMTENAIEIAARQLNQGDGSALQNVGRGAQGDEKLTQIKNRAAEILVQEGGMSPSEAASHISSRVQEFKARGIGLSAESRTAATREANLNIILKATEAAIPAALEASRAVSRTGWVPINQIIQKGQVVASNPELKEFGMANLQLAEHWARAMNPTGVMRESDRDKALEFLSTADSQSTYERAVNQLHKQIKREQAAVASQRPAVPGGHAPSESSAAAPATTPKRVKQNGHTYEQQSDGSYKAID